MHRIRKPKEPYVLCFYASTALVVLYVSLVFFGILEIVVNLSLMGGMLIFSAILGLCASFSTSVSLVTGLVLFSQVLLFATLMIAMVYLTRIPYFLQTDTMNGVILKNELLQIWTAFCVLHCVLFGIVLLWVFFILAEYRKYLKVLKSAKLMQNSSYHPVSKLGPKDAKWEERYTGSHEDSTAKESSNSSEVAKNAFPAWQREEKKYVTPVQQPQHHVVTAEDTTMDWRIPTREEDEERQHRRAKSEDKSRKRSKSSKSRDAHGKRIY